LKPSTVIRGQVVDPENHLTQATPDSGWENAVTNYALEGPKWTTNTVTWSFASLGTPNSSQFSDAIGGAYQDAVRTAVARWDDVVNLSFQEVPDSTPGVDIRIGWSTFTGSQIGEAEYSYTPGSQTTFRPGLSIRLEDPAAHPLSAGPAFTYQGTSTSLYEVALHEFGHALGLDHSADPTAIMYPSVGAANADLSVSDLQGIHALYAPPAFAMTDSTAGTSSHPDGSAYSGSVSYLQQQFIYSGSDSVAISSSQPNVFIHGGSGNDALAVSSGQNVVDGGVGSNFLVGGTGADGGTDTFFADGRGSGTTWSSIVNFHHGDAATFWGFNPATSVYTWTENDGAAGYQGATIHSAIQGVGTPVNASLTFAGMSVADVQRNLTITTGTVGGNDYMLLQVTG
jgi:hypothetical protein